MINADKNTSAAIWSPDISRTNERKEESSVRFAGKSERSARILGPRPGAKPSCSASIGRSSRKTDGLASRISGVRSSDGRDAVREISSGTKCWSCSGTAIHIGSSETLSGAAGRMLSAGAAIKPTNSGDGFSDAIQFAIWWRTSVLRSTNWMPTRFFESASQTTCAETLILCSRFGSRKRTCGR